MTLKKLLALLISCMLVLSLAACGGTSSSAAPSAEESQEAASGEQSDAPETTAEMPDSIQFVVASTAGGFADTHARIVAQYLQESTGIPVAVVNQAEGGGIVAYDTVKNADPDGSTLLFYHSNFIIACETGVYDADPIADFTTVANLYNGGSQAIVVSADSEYQTLDDLVNAALADPGKVSFGMQTGGASHFIGVLLGADKDAEFDLVEAGNQTEKITSLLGGFIDACNIGCSTARQYVESGDMRVLTTTAATTDPFFPEFPNPVDQGYPSLVYDSEFWLIGPAGMDPALVEVLNAAFKDMEADTAAVEALTTQGVAYTWTDVAASNARMQEQVDLHKKLAAEIAG